MRYELVIIWDDGIKDIHEYATEENAEQSERGYKKAFGKQIEWSGIRPKKEGGES